MVIAKAAVREYGYSFGYNQDYSDVLIAMGNIINDYPGSPMAKIAQDFIDRANEVFWDKFDKNLLEIPENSILNDNLDLPLQAPPYPALEPNTTPLKNFNRIDEPVKDERAPIVENKMDIEVILPEKPAPRWVWIFIVPLCILALGFIVLIKVRTIRRKT